MRAFKSVFLVLLILALPAVVVFGVGATIEPAPPSSRPTPFTRAPGRAREVSSPVDPKLFKAASAALDKPDNPHAQVAYALALEEKAREVGNAAYHQLAEKAARAALAIKPDHPTGRGALAVALLGQHRFGEALAYVRSATTGRPVWRLAIEYDALYELGQYDEAGRVVQELSDLKPGAESYPRAAQFRELIGNPEGAIELWGFAYNDGAARTTARAWTLAQIGETQLRRGDVGAAHAAFVAALEDYPRYHLACLGLARCFVAEDKLAPAEDALLPLLETHGDLVLGGLLGDAQAALGKTDAAKATWDQALQAEEFSARNGIADRRAHAVFLADHDRDLDRAVTLAREELAARPTVANEDALAWALYKKGDLAEARTHSERARRLGTKNGWFDYHAGAIELALGNKPAAKKLLEEALLRGLRTEPLQRQRAQELLGKASS